MLDIVCTPTPFIVGLLSSSLPQLTELPLEEVREIVSHLPYYVGMVCNLTCSRAQVLVVDLENSRLLRQVTAPAVAPFLLNSSPRTLANLVLFANLLTHS